MAFSARLYVTPLGTQQVVFPYHRSSTEIRLAGQHHIYDQLRLEAAPEINYAAPYAARILSPPVQVQMASNRSTNHELILIQPGFAYVNNSMEIAAIASEEVGNQATVILRLQAVHAPKALVVEITLTRSSATERTVSYIHP